MRNYIFLIIFFIHTALSLNANILNSLQGQPIPNEENKVNYEIDMNDGKVSYESELNEHSYSYRLTTADGTIKYESGHFEDSDLVVEGGYEYIGDDGLVYSVTYIADKNGYRSQVSFGSRSMVSPPSIAPRPPLQCYPGSTDPRCPGTTTSEPPGDIGFRIGPEVPQEKGIDSALICSLAGSGCK